MKKNLLVTLEGKNVIFILNSKMSLFIKLKSKAYSNFKINLNIIILT